MATAADVPVSIDNSEKQGKVEVDLASTSKPLKEKKIGHRRVDATTGQTTYKKTPSSTLSSAIQLGISHTVGKLVSKQERDVLMQDFQVVETTMFLAEGSNITPAHHYEDFRFKTYAPVAFRYFRDLFGIQPADYMLSISNNPLTELSNPGASGSLFFVTHDDEFIIKTVQHKEAEFLQKLLPGYYMNLVQNPRTLLPKFYGLYCIQAGGKNIRIVVMNNLLPRALKMHLKFDLKGSTFKRKASKNERAKNSPTFKDLDILTDLPDGVQLDPDVYAAFIKTMQRDCLVLQSFKIMDYSLLLGIHYVDKDKNRSENRDSQDLDGKKEKRKSSDSDSTDYSTDFEGKVVGSLKKQRPLYNNKPTDSIMSSTLLREKYHTDLDIWTGGIPATSPRGDRLLLFCGIIDILQCYKLKKKLEHTIKAALYDADSVSVHRPGFYCDRFQKFMSDHVFKKTPGPVKTQPSKKRAQTTRKVNDGQFGGVTSAAKNSSPAVHSKASTPRQGGKKLQSDRPDLLPSESPRPWSNGNDSQDEQPDTSSQMQYKTPPRMQIKMEERSPNLSNDISHEPSLPPSSYKSTNDVDKQLLSNFSTHQKETTFKGPAYSSSVDVSDLQAVKVDQVQLQWKENSAHGEPVTSGSDEKIQDFNPVDENKDGKQLSNFIVEKENGQPISENNSTEAPKRVIQDTAF